MPRPPIVLLHGALGAASQMEPLAERLAGRHDVHRLDLAGHGAAAGDEGDVSIERLAAELLDFVRARRLDGATVFGYSMGGYVALHLAATCPDVVGRVFTLGTKLAWSPDVAAGETRQLDAAAIRAKVPRFAALLAERHGEDRWERVLSRTAALLRSLGDRPRVDGAALAAIGCPVRLAVGDRDATVSLEETRDAVRALAHGELEVLPGTPHPFERVPLDRLAWSLGEFASRG